MYSVGSIGGISLACKIFGGATHVRRDMLMGRLAQELAMRFDAGNALLIE
jgi:hypothetical protein